MKELKAGLIQGILGTVRSRSPLASFLSLET